MSKENMHVIRQPRFSTEGFLQVFQTISSTIFSKLVRKYRERVQSLYCFLNKPRKLLEVFPSDLNTVHKHIEYLVR